MDANFHQRHRASAGTGPAFYNPRIFISKEQVDVVGKHIERVRRRPPKPRTPSVPDEAIDACEKSYEAADGNKAKADLGTFDDTGLMALICRHDIPLFFANIDTPGEQQKYAVALLEHVFGLLPSHATVVAYYDIACVLSRSLESVSALHQSNCQPSLNCHEQYDILPKDLTSRLRLRTSAMHAYGHQWSCQLVYNPQMQVGSGLSDGEGVERLWSRFRGMIGITRSSGVCILLKALEPANIHYYRDIGGYGSLIGKDKRSPSSFAMILETLFVAG